MDTDYKAIAEEIKSKGFAVEKCEMNDEVPDEWVVFSVWFYLQRNFYIDLDWKTGTYYFYLDSSKDAIKSYEPKIKTLDPYSAEDFLADHLLKHYDLLKEIADKVHSSGFYMTEDTSVMDLFEDEAYRAILYWIVDENGDDTVYCVCNRNIPLMMFSPYADREKLLDEAKRREFEIIKEKPDWASDDDDLEEDELEYKIVGFKEIDFLF
jgi:hypothetical protein